MEEFDLNSFLPYLLNRTGARVALRFTELLRDYGISLQGWRVIAALQHEKALNVGALAEKTSIEIWTVSRLARALEDQGYLFRERSGPDGRTVTVRLAPGGRDLAARIIPHARRYEAAMWRGFTDTESAFVRDALCRMYENLAVLEEEEDEAGTSSDRAGSNRRETGT